MVGGGEGEGVRGGAMFGLSRRLIYAQEQSSFDPTGCLAFSYVNSSLRPFVVRSLLQAVCSLRPLLIHPMPYAKFASASGMLAYFFLIIFMLWSSEVCHASNGQCLPKSLVV